MTRTVRIALAASLATFGLAAPVLAGPPLLCFPLETGGAPSLPWREGGGWKGMRADYDRARLAQDTLALLGPQVDTLARMETLRRAALYAHEAGSGRRLLAALEARVQKASGDEHARALFDHGYALGTLTQAGALGGERYRLPAAANERVQEAIRERGGDPAMEYAAALIHHDGEHREAAFEHLRRAVVGAPAGSPLARTLTAHGDLWGGALERARAAVARK
jgi:hypothetical protein